MKILILGGGIIGVASAWFLNQAGYDVTVVDRQSGAGRETSFANGCQISVSHAEPWANPAAPMKLLKWLGREDAPLLFRLRPEMQQWLWGMQFLRECTQARTNDNIRQIVNISEYSRQTLGQLRSQLPFNYDCLTKGILHFYTDEREFENSLGAAALMRELGCNRESISREKVLEIEPALQNIASQIVGGDFTQSDESGDIHKFTHNLAQECEKRGVKFLYNTQVTRLVIEEQSVVGAEIITEEGRYNTIFADKTIVCMGSYSQPLLKAVGIALMIYPGKGYSATYNITNSHLAPTVSITDDEYKIVLTRIGDRLRVAGTCELNGFNRELNPIRCEALTKRTKYLFPNSCDFDNPIYWSGLRPLTPSNVPYIGESKKYAGLYINTGHGTLGWTMGAGSGRAIADIIQGRKPEVDFKFI